MWSPPLGLLANVLAPIQQIIDQIPSAHLVPPVTGELLNPEEAYEHLQNFAFSQGFYEKAEITTNWMSMLEKEKAYVSFKGVSVVAQKAWFLGITNSSYGNTPEMVPNPLSYTIHAQRQPQYMVAIEQAIALNQNHSTVEEESELTALFTYLKDKCFHIHTRYAYELDPATTQLIRKYLEQLVCLSDTQIILAQKYSSSFMVEIDTMFNTNSVRFPLAIVTGVSNTEKAFPIAFSFILAEDKVSMVFLLESLKELVWNEYLPPKVIIDDQGGGLISALSTVMPETQLQLCE
ncbi:MAG: hypothetical protein M1839_004199 [Geoglossum umbratile]|nr:MAG: hypothetical protein M1839_004199 [Geoglossum umbratile]